MDDSDFDSIVKNSFPNEGTITSEIIEFRLGNDVHNDAAMRIIQTTANSRSIPLTAAYMAECEAQTVFANGRHTDRSLSWACDV